MKKKATLLFSSLWMVSAMQVSAQAPAIEWDKTYGGAGREELRCMTLTPEGGYVLAGYTQSGISGDKTQATRGGIDIWLVRTAPDGSIINERTIGGAGTDYPASIKATPDGGYILIASSNSNIGGEKDDTAKGRASSRGAIEADLWVIKLNATIDTIQWQKTIGGDNTDYPADIIPTTDGGYLIGAYSRSDSFGDKTSNRYVYPAVARTNDYWILKLNSVGEIQWQKQMGGIKDDYLYAIAATSDGGFIAGGQYSGDTVGKAGTMDMSDVNRGDNDWWVVKCDVSGNIQWNKTIGGSKGDVLDGIIQTSDGGYLLTGGSESGISGDKTEDVMSNNQKDYWIVKLNSTGDIEWDKVYGGTAEDQYVVAVETQDGGFVLAGESTSPANPTFTNKLTDRPYHHIWVLKVDRLGDKVWEKSIGTDTTVKFDHRRCFLATPDGGYVVGGYTVAGIVGDKTDISRGDRDFWVVKLGKDCTSDTTKTYLEDIICKGGVYTLPGGAVITEAGVYYDTLISSANCDSVLAFTLTQPVINTSVTVENGTATVAGQGATYQWVTCANNQPIHGETNASYTPSSTGNYAVVVIVDGCSDTSECQEVIPTSVVDHDRAAEVRIYPNPVSGQLHINAPFAVNITISTMDGRIAMVRDQVKTLDVSGLSEGVYLLRATDATGALIRTEKLVKVK